jgi:hypothetical protein
MKMTTGSASSGRMIAVYQRPCSAMMSALRALAHLDLGFDRLGGEIGRGAVLRILRGQPGLVGVDEAVDDRRGHRRPFASHRDIARRGTIADLPDSPVVH